MVVVVSAMGVGGLAASSSASTPKPPKFVAHAPGAVTCTLTAKIKFSTPVTEAGGGTASTVKGTLKNCTSTTAAVTIKVGKLTGSLVGSPVNCVGPSSGAAQGSLSIAWKGDVNGVVNAITYAGKATFNASSSNVTGDDLVTNGSNEEGLQILGTSAGSFPGSVSVSAFSADTASQLSAMCETKTTTPSGKGHGIKTLTLTGPITVGTVGAMASDGMGFCAVLTSGTVNCWGDGSDGALGNNSTSNSRVPVIINVTTATGIASDSSHSYCAVLLTGGVDCWGNNADGELGADSVASDSLTPVAVSGIDTADAIASDGDHSYCALLNSGAADCWGLGTDGELGNAMAASSDVPVTVSGLFGATSLASEGSGSYCAVLAGGTAECWGNNGSGDLGDNSTAQSDVPVAVSGLSSVATIASDGDHSYCAALTSGSVDCWGKAADGQLGDGSTSDSHVPVAVSGITSASSVASNGNDSYCAVVVSGTIDCWGLDSVGQLGNGGMTNADVPVAATGISDGEIVAGDGVNSYCAVLGTAAVDCWGAGSNGQLGNGAGTDSDVPVTAAPMTAAASIIGEGTGTFCAPLASEGVDCWGSNGSGALGAGLSGSNSLVPVAVSDLTL